MTTMPPMKTEALEAERSVLGACLINPDVLPGVVDIVGTDPGKAFTIESNALVYEAMLDLLSRGEPVDTTMIAEYFHAHGHDDKIVAMAELVSAVPTSHNALDYARMVSRASSVRALIRIMDGAYGSLKKGGVSIDSVLDEMDSALVELRKENHGQRDYDRPIARVADSLIANYDEIMSGKQSAGLPTGISFIDEAITGVRPGDFVIIVARPSVGKTAFLLNVLLNIVQREKKPALFFSLEMDAEQCVERLLQILSRQNPNWIRQRYGSGHAVIKEFRHYKTAVLDGLDLEIYDKPNLSLAEIQRVSRDWKKRKPEGAVISLDYVQLLRSLKKYRSEQEELADVSVSCKNLARELKVANLCAAQINREAEKETSPFRMLAQIKGSGAFEQDGDKIMVLYRLRPPRPNETVRYDVTRHIGAAVVKNRNGPLANGILTFERETQCMYAESWGDESATPPAPSSAKYEKKPEAEPTPPEPEVEEELLF